MTSMPRLCALLTIGCLVAPAFGQDRAEIDPTKIIGNRELPKVLYIVPWKKPLPGFLFLTSATHFVTTGSPAGVSAR